MGLNSREKQEWVVCTARARVLLADVYLSGRPHLSGSRSLPTISVIRLSSWPRRAQPPLRSASSSEINTEFPRLRESPAAKYSESRKSQAWAPRCPRTSTTSSRRPSTSESTWRSTALTAMPISEMPEDLHHLIKKAVNIRKHMEKYRADRDAKFRLICVESRIHRLARYYRNVKVLRPTWRYVSKRADTLI